MDSSPPMPLGGPEEAAAADADGDVDEDEDVDADVDAEVDADVDVVGIDPPAATPAAAAPLRLLDALALNSRFFKISGVVNPS